MARYDVDRAELAALLHDEPAYRVDQVWHGLYRELAGPEELSVLPGRLRRRLAESVELSPALRLVTRREADRGKTVKWLWQLDDGARVETVLMEYRDRATVCVSSQAGCAMGCGFCATGQAGFRRNLSVGEIVEQVVRAGTERSGSRPGNVVFMGMGEPLSNYRAVWPAVERLHSELGISARHL